MALFFCDLFIPEYLNLSTALQKFLLYGTGTDKFVNHRQI